MNRTVKLWLCRLVSTFGCLIWIAVSLAGIGLLALIATGIYLASSQTIQDAGFLSFLGDVALFLVKVIGCLVGFLAVVFLAMHTEVAYKKYGIKGLFDGRACDIAAAQKEGE